MAVAVVDSQLLGLDEPSERLPKSLFGSPDFAVDAVVTSPYVLDLPHAGLALPCNQACLP